MVKQRREQYEISQMWGERERESNEEVVSAAEGGLREDGFRQIPLSLTKKTLDIVECGIVLLF